MAATRITRAKVAEIAGLARLELTEAELDERAADLGAVLEHFALLERVDTTGVPPHAEAMPIRAPLRADEVRAGLAPTDVVANAPAQEDGAFAVPRVLTREKTGG